MTGESWHDWQIDRALEALLDTHAAEQAVSKSAEIELGERVPGIRAAILTKMEERGYNLDELTGQLVANDTRIDVAIGDQASASEVADEVANSLYYLLSIDEEGLEEPFRSEAIDDHKRVIGYSLLAAYGSAATHPFREAVDDLAPYGPAIAGMSEEDLYLTPDGVAYLADVSRIANSARLAGEIGALVAKDLTRRFGDRDDAAAYAHTIFAIAYSRVCGSVYAELSPDPVRRVRDAYGSDMEYVMDMIEIVSETIEMEAPQLVTFREQWPDAALNFVDTG
jgi:hypothetical protein